MDNKEKGKGDIEEQKSRVRITLTCKSVKSVEKGLFNSLQGNHHSRQGQTGRENNWAGPHAHQNFTHHH
jgi:hypothetical protein